jgi:hypothetical protein
MIRKAVPHTATISKAAATEKNLELIPLFHYFFKCYTVIIIDKLRILSKTVKQSSETSNEAKPKTDLP